MIIQHKIVIVEDDLHIRNILYDELGEYIVTRFGLCIPAIEYIKLNDVDLILLDLNLPDESGIEVLKLAKKKNIKVLIITGFSSEYLNDALVLEYLDRLIEKPFKIKDVVSKIYQYFTSGSESGNK